MNDDSSDRKKKQQQYPGNSFQWISILRNDNENNPQSRYKIYNLKYKTGNILWFHIYFLLGIAAKLNKKVKIQESSVKNF
jgi:hypothetical protein